ncbi:MAG: LegC family aminotransferase [Pseudomonadota bacterium]
MLTGEKKIIPLCVPEIRGNEWKYIKECLDTNWVSSVGKYVDKFERSVADYVGAHHSVACVNGTAALHMALLVAGVQPEDEVLVPSLTFVAPANAVRYTGAWPVFIDVQPDIWQMDPRKVEDFLTNECEQRHGQLTNKNTGRPVKGIMPVHILGHPVDMDPILEIAQKYGLKVIEDATESLGADYKGCKVGTLSDLACFSFNGNKIITSGGGGMILTNNKELADKARYLTTQAKSDGVEYIHNEIGYNYRLTNLAAAMGLAQMEKLAEYVKIKRRIAQTYSEGLKDLKGITLPVNAEWANSTFWIYTILVNEKEYGMNSRALLNKLEERGIQTRPFWHPVHSLKPFRNCYAYKIEVADRLYRDGLSLPSSIGISQHDQERVIRMIRENVSGK